MLRPVVVGPFVKGLIASTDPITQPKGSVSRISNFIYTQRGALTTCDGTAIINAFNGVPTAGRGKFLSAFLFSPIGIDPYYLVLAIDSGQSLYTPSGLSGVAATGGTLAPGNYYYVVTALDGAGGETPISNEALVSIAGPNNAATLTWNTVPNAWGYNIYRGGSGDEVLLIGSGLPTMQPSPITATTSFTDTGFVSVGIPYAIASWSRTPYFGARKLITINTTGLTSIQSGQTVTVSGTGVIDGVYQITSVSGTTLNAVAIGGSTVSGVGGTVTGGGTSPPIANTTQQVVLYRMPNAPTLPITYSDGNIVARFPICPLTIGTPPSGGTGGPTGLPGSTISGGVVGMTCLIPQMLQFTNRVVIALGNGFPPQLYWEASGTPVNPSPTAPVSSATVDANGIVTVSTSSLSPADPTGASGVYLPPGSNVSINTNLPAYNGFFIVLSVSSTSFTYYDPAAIGAPAASSGNWTAQVTPIINTFVPAYPAWVASSLFGVNSVVVPTVANGFYFKAIQGGDSGPTQPTWPLTPGAQIQDGGVLWQNAGLVADSVPPPPGAAHIAVYAGSLWVWNTYPSDAASGLDGPTSLRMSDVDNPNSWNPVNQAFLDKDDGSDGMGLATFTISAEGIPPEGSLVAFKDFAGYQIIGVFGSSNFAIQRIRSDMGCSAPRTIRFVPGFGIFRYAHLGVANFDGVRDQVMSEEVRPFLFASNSAAVADITPLDPYWLGVSYADLTAAPAMYCLAIPVGAGGSSGGALTRILAFDLVLKAWSNIDLPFAISLVYQARSAETTTPITLFGGFSDGLLQRWQANDINWLVGGSGFEPPSPVQCFVNLPDATGKTPDQKMQFRRIAIRGISNGALSLSVTPLYNNIPITPPQRYPLPASGIDYNVFASGGFKNGWRFGAVLTVVGPTEIDRVTYHLVDKTVGVPGVIS